MLIFKGPISYLFSVACYITMLCKRQTMNVPKLLKLVYTLGLRKAEQSLKTGLFYYDEIPTPCSAPKFLCSGGNCSAELSPNLGLSRDGVEVLRGYN